MIEYLEAVQILPANSTEEPDFIRIELTGYTKSEIETIVKTVEELMSYVSPYKITKHICRHDERLPCIETGIVEGEPYGV